MRGLSVRVDVLLRIDVLLPEEARADEIAAGLVGVHGRSFRAIAVSSTSMRRIAAS